MKKSNRLFALSGAMLCALGLHIAFSTRFTFADFGLTDVAVLAAGYALLRRTAGRKADGLTAVFAVGMASAYCMARSILETGGLVELLMKRPLALPLAVAGHAVLLYGGLRLVLDAQGNVCKGLLVRQKGFFSRHFQALAFLSILVSWLTWIVINYPGTFCYDAYDQIERFFGAMPFTRHHPPLSTYLLGWCMLLGRRIGGPNAGVLLYLLLHTFAGAGIFAYGLERLHRRGVRAEVCWLGVAYFVLVPIWGASAQWYEKDLLYAEGMTLFGIRLAEVVADRRCTWRDACWLGGSALLASLLRNNGIYAVVPTLALLAWWLHPRKTALITLTAVVGLYIGVDQWLYPQVLHIQDGSVREALSIPFQQTARYVSRYDAEVTEEERAAIDAVLDYETIRTRYQPQISDPVKDTYHGQPQELRTYLRTWLQMLRKHPTVYVESFLNGSCAYLAPVGAEEIRSSVVVYKQEEAEWSLVGTLGSNRPMTRGIRLLMAICEKTKQLPLARYLWTPGLYTWVVLLCLLVALKRHCAGAWLLLVPQGMNVLVCMAGPLANSLRYALPVAAAAPLLVGWTLYWAASRK